MSVAIIKSPRIRVAIVVLVVLLGFHARQRTVQIDPEVFPYSSVSAVRGLTLYLFGSYQSAANAYRAHYKDRYEGYDFAPHDQVYLLLSQQLQKAQNLAKEALAKDSGDVHALLTMGEVALMENRSDEALTHFARVLNHETDQFDALLLSSVAYAQQKRYGDAIGALNLALRHGRVQSRITSFLAALHKVGELHSLSTPSRPWCLLAQYHRYLRIFDPANSSTVRRLAHKAIEAGDRPADAYLAIGILHSKKWQTEEALAAFLQAVKADPTHAEALRWASVTYGKRGDITNEYRLLKLAHEASPKDPFYANRLADHLTDELGDYHQALAVALSSLEQSVPNSEGYDRLGKIHSLLGDYETSIQYYQRAIRLNSKNFWAYLGLGSTLRASGNHEEAIHTYNKATALRPRSPHAHIGLAHIYHDMRRYEDAIKEYEIGIQFGRNETVQLVGLCGMYAGISNFAKAVDCYKKALRQDPNDVTARRNLVDAEKNLELSRITDTQTK